MAYGMTPKQIIYPLGYFKALLSTPDAEAESKAFCAGLAPILGSKVSVTPMGRARMGLHLLVKYALRSGRRKVVLSPYTIPDVVNMVALAGAEPVFVDFAPGSTLIDLGHLESLLTPDVAATIITHYHVNQSGLGEIKGLCEARGVLLFEDCAISLGGTVGGRHVGTQSDGAILSLSSFKFLNYFWGGVVFSRQPAVAEFLRQETKAWPRLGRRDYFPQVLRTLKYDLATRSPFFDWGVAPLIRFRQRRSTETVNLAPPRLESEAIDSTLTALPSASALSEWRSKLSIVDQHLRHRRMIASIYDRYLADRMVSQVPGRDVRDGACFVNYPVYAGQSLRNTVYRKLILDGLDVGASLYPNCHEHNKFRSAAGKSDSVRDLVRSVITLPTHPRVTEEYAHVLGETVARLLKDPLDA